MAIALSYSTQADAAMSALEVDPDQAGLLSEVDDALARLSETPDDQHLRTKTFRLLGSGDVVHYTNVATTDWVIVWQSAPDTDGLWIRYIGPTTEASLRV